MNKYHPTFYWGVAGSAFQTEGAHDLDGKGISIWDTFSSKKGRIRNNDHAKDSCQFYHKYKEDLDLLLRLGIKNYRFSISWSRILPNGTGIVNEKGLDFYRELIDSCLEREIAPWVTLYHWDLPQALQEKGGWVNRDIIGWFGEYIESCLKGFGDRVKFWMVMNEPVVFTGAGYFLGIHAPGKRGMKYFLPAVHHAALCQSGGARIIKSMYPSAEVGSTYSCSMIHPASNSVSDLKAATRADALLNRLFIEPAIGRGYPYRQLPFLKKIEKYIGPDDESNLTAPFDFIGIQNYTREVVSSAWYIPYINARIIPANKRKVYRTEMNWEVYPKGIYDMIRKYSSYSEINSIIVTENGASFNDNPGNGEVYDAERLEFLRNYIGYVEKARNEGYPVKGYFVWSFLDNFEWTEGYQQRFGLVHVDYSTQKRTVKESGKWYSNYIKQS